MESVKVENTKVETTTPKKQNAFVKSLKKHWQLYLLLLPPLIYLIVFKYVPMYGVQIAFRDYNPAAGIMGSKWVGFKYF